MAVGSERLALAGTERSFLTHLASGPLFTFTALTNSAPIGTLASWPWPTPARIPKQASVHISRPFDLHDAIVATDPIFPS